MIAKVFQKEVKDQLIYELSLYNRAKSRYYRAELKAGREDFEAYIFQQRRELLKVVPDFKREKLSKFFLGQDKPRAPVLISRSYTVEREVEDLYLKVVKEKPLGQIECRSQDFIAQDAFDYRLRLGEKVYVAREIWLHERLSIPIISEDFEQVALFNKCFVPNGFVDIIMTESEEHLLLAFLLAVYVSELRFTLGYNKRLSIGEERMRTVTEDLEIISYLDPDFEERILKKEGATALTDAFFHEISP